MKERVESSSCVPSQRCKAAVPTSLHLLHHTPLHQATADCNSSREKQSLSPPSPTLSESSSVSLSSPVPSSKKYARKEKIGQGAQGSVYRCIENATGKEVAVKVIMTHELSSAEIEAIKREVKTIKRLHHRNLVEYYKATEKKARQLSIYMEFVAGGSLSSKLRHDGALPLSSARRFTRQLCEALQFLHQNRIAHRDIKCANVFLTSSGEDVKLGDFGAFKEVGSVSLVGGLKGTPHWMAPEVIRAEQQTSEDGWFKADIWSLGCAVIEMLTGHSPWQQYSNPLTAMYQIVSSDKTPTIPANATEETASFLSLCLQRNPADRASIIDLLHHPFLQTTLENNHIERECHLEREKHVETQQGFRQSNIKLASCLNQRTVGEDERHEQTDQKTNPRGLRTPHFRTQAQGSVIGRQCLMSPKAYTEVTPSVIPTRPTLRKPSVITRLKPLELTQSPSNQERENASPAKRGLGAPSTQQVPLIVRGSSTGTIENTQDLSPHGPVRPVRLRRLSTAPAPIREPEDILGCAPPHQKLKLPPLSARPASSTALSGVSFHR